MARGQARTRSATIAVALMFSIAGGAQAQERRRAAPGERLPEGISFPRGSGDPRAPFAGLWDGATIVASGPGAGDRLRVIMRLEVADTTKVTYTGTTIHPGHGQAPHVNTVVRDRTMEWTQPNSGGGQWAYAARLVSRDSIAGTIELRDWPQLPKGETPPRGTFALKRRPMTTRAREGA